MRTMLDQGFRHRRDGHSPHSPATASYCARTALVACHFVRTPLMTCPSAAPPPTVTRVAPRVRAVTQVSAGGVH